MDGRNRLYRHIGALAGCALVVVALMRGPTAPAAAAGGGWSTGGTAILDPAGGQFIISGVNWFGFETRDEVAHGL